MYIVTNFFVGIVNQSEALKYFSIKHMYIYRRSWKLAIDHKAGCLCVCVLIIFDFPNSF